jgi:branched-subunit amino acid aminotransferase/4-amino-4-deoxychorismate lyase
VFIVTNGRVVITPEERVLKGITRMKVLGLAEENYRVEKRQVTIEELFRADEVFLTSTTKRILPVVKINDKIIGNGTPGPVTTELFEAFMKLEQEAVSGC